MKNRNSRNTSFGGAGDSCSILLVGRVLHTTTRVTRSTMRQHMLLLLSSFLVFALVLTNHEASGIDLNPLKSRHSTSSSTSHSIARTGSNHHHHNNNNNRVADASTGTVTALEPGTEKEPVTCNEIMAKAVVIASEEKEAAIADRNDALLQATQANHIAQDLKSIIDAALQEAKNATIEYEAMKLMTDRLVEQAKNDAHQDMNESKQQHELLLKKMNLQHQLAMDEWNAQTLQVKEAAHKLILQTQHNAAQNVAAVQQEMKTLESFTELQIQTLQNDTELQIQTIQKESQKEIYRAYSDAKRTTNEALDRSHQIETDAQDMAEQAMRNADSLISDVQRNSKYQVQEVKDQCTATVNQANEHFTKVINDLEVQQQEFASSAAKKEAARVKELTDQCTAQTTQLSTTIDDLEVKHLDLVSTAAKNETALESNIQTQANVIVSLEQMNTHLTRNLNDANQQLRYWMELHDNQGIVNTTLVMIHSRAVKDRSLLVAEKKTKEGYHIMTQHTRAILTQVQSCSQPHLEKIHKIYKTHLQETVDSDIIPFYKRYVVPLQHRAQKEVKEVVAPISAKCQQKKQEMMAIIKDHSRQQFEHICHLVQVKAAIVNKFLQSDKVQTEVNVPESLIAVLVGIEEDSTMFVSVVLKIIAVFVIYKSRYAIFKLVLWLCFLPLRITWYLCPLKLLFQGRKGSTGTSTSTSSSKKKINGNANANVNANVNANRVVSEGRNGSSKGTAKKALIKKENEGHEKSE